MVTAARRAGGFTLIELLVVISIISILMGLLLVGAMGAMEASHKNTCANNLRQIAYACEQHVSKNQYYPSGGWGRQWTGDPNMGTGAKQPGGWLYSLLPYVDAGKIHDMGKGLDFAAKRKMLAEMRATPVSIYICPSRRRAFGHSPPNPTLNADAGISSCKTDYAGNGGSLASGMTDGPGVDCLTKYPDCGGAFATGPGNGVIMRRSEVSPAAIKDGATNTILCGEKFLNPDHYYSGVGQADLNTAFEGYDSNSIRWVPAIGGYGADQRRPMRDTAPEDLSERFGSTHRGVFLVAFCDASIHSLNFAVDLETFARLGTRDDMLPIRPEDF
jgi:prepilin-type N-terminal cleavage/methylation domain-containing protein